MPTLNTIRLASIILLAALISGCASSAMRSVADSLSLAITNQNDLETVRDGEPAYLLLIDGFILNDPDNEDLLLAGARLYDTYAGIFVEDKARAARLSDKAHDYARRAICQPHPTVCQYDKGSFDGFAREITKVKSNELPLLYGYATAWAGWIQAHSGDFRAIAELPKVELAFEQIIKLDPAYERGQAQLYLGVLRTLRPPALGGKPEVGRKHFENAIKYSDGRNLYAKVEFARRYARLIFDRKLHDKLLNEVMDADPKESGLTLGNTLAQQQARQLLDSSAAYFEE